MQPVDDGVALRRVVEPPPEPVFDTPVATVPTAKVPQEDDKVAKKADAELEKIASDLARAKTIDDCDDKMAETLFGEEFSLMAAQVAASAPPDLSANDDMESETEDVAAVPGADLEGAAAINVNPEAKPNGQSPKLDPSASERLATVRALNSTPNHLPPVAAQPATKPSAPAAPPQPGSKPESIEDQFETSMTQTLEALSISKPPIGVGVQDEDDDDENSGFFGRFRRS